MTLFSKHEGQTEFGVLCAKLARDAPKGSFGRGDEIILLSMSVAVLHGN
jgi:hypothetical protein